MAEGAEDTENSSNNPDTPAMLGAMLPCEALTASICGIKREFDAIGLNSTSSSPPNINISNSSGRNSYPIVKSVSPITVTATATLKSPRTTKSPSPTSSLGGEKNVQQHPINLKSEISENELAIRLRGDSPCNSIENQNSSDPGKMSPDFLKNFSSKDERLSSSPQHLNEKINSHQSSSSTKTSTTSNSQCQLNGTMQDMINLQKLQNLATMQQQQQQHSSVVPSASALASLQGLAGLSSAAAALNSPLNLSVGSSSTLSSSSSLGNIAAATMSNNSNLPSPSASAAAVIAAALSAAVGTAGPGGGGGLLAPGCTTSTTSPQMPQLILASGQLVQGVQGAQLLIPTSQGISVQTILTIPVSQQISTNEQFMQNYSPFATASTIPPPPPPPTHHHSLSSLQSEHNFLKPNLLSNGVQQLLAALHPQMFPSSLQQHPSAVSGHHHQAEQQLHHQSQHNQGNLEMGSTSSGGSGGISLNMQQLPKSLSGVNISSSGYALRDRRSVSPRNETISQSPFNRAEVLSPVPSNQLSQHLRTSPARGLSISTHPKLSPPRNAGSNFGGGGHQEKSSSSSERPTPPSATNATYTPPSGSQYFHSHSPNSHMTTSSAHSLSSQVNSPTSSSTSAVLNSINRLTCSNGELTITKSHPPGATPSHNHHSMTASSSSPSPGSQTNHHHHQAVSQSMKLSPSSMHLSPTGTEASTSDLLVDSPNEPTINQTTCNVVDGIDLDEIKEFAKAFKLRRLSLGLTQTQVGQALSVTEGPAYSQSAICSALAAQVYAAQLSTQQQNMFEKLDITPKSAQKIKPVLERWMKEAEESHWNRYKTGQNHLTDFIGVEPSKKRKRRTSFTPQALELLNAHFERNTHPSGTEITGLAHQLGYEREVIRIWFCNKRQALKNTVRMMSKGMV